MYDITKIRMLLTTAVFAAVAALFAAGANARIPENTSSAFAAQESLGDRPLRGPAVRDEGGPALREEREGFRQTRALPSQRRSRSGSVASDPAGELTGPWSSREVAGVVVDPPGLRRCRSP